MSILGILSPPLFLETAKARLPPRRPAPGGAGPQAHTLGGRTQSGLTGGSQAGRQGPISTGTNPLRTDRSCSSPPVPPDLRSCAAFFAILNYTLLFLTQHSRVARPVVLRRPACGPPVCLCLPCVSVPPVCLCPMCVCACTTQCCLPPSCCRAARPVLLRRPACGPIGWSAVQ